MNYTDLAEWVADRQEYGDDGTGHCDYFPTTCESCLLEGGE